MRIIMLSICIISSFLYNKKMYKIIEIESEVYNLYINNFEGYILSDAKYNLTIDKNKLEKYFNDKGYSVTFNDNLSFEVSFDYLGKWEKTYNFYMVINDDN